MTRRMWALPVAGVGLGIWLGGGVAVFATQAANGAGAPGPVQSAIQFVAADTKPPGFRLPDGLTVPAGTRLLGAVFPTVNAFDNLTAGGWEANFVVTGDPSVVRRSLIGELKSGIGPEGRVECGAANDLGRGSPLRALTSLETDGHHVDWVFCQFAAFSPTRSASAYLYYGYESGLRMFPPTSVLTLDVGPRRAATPSTHPLPQRPVEIPTVLAAPQGVPQPGDVAGQHTFGPFKVVAGSQPIAPMLETEGRAVFVVRVTGEPDAVFSAYARELNERGGGTPLVRTGSSPYGEWRTAGTDNGSDAGNGWMTMVQTSGGTFLELTVT